MMWFRARPKEKTEAEWAKYLDDLAAEIRFSSAMADVDRKRRKRDRDKSRADALCRLYQKRVNGRDE